MATVTLNKISKSYPGAAGLSVDNVSFTVEDGEFMVLLGPSGCGKSTTLRMIAGLESISKGEMGIDGRVINEVAAKDRDIAMVFQSYALYPHMTVAENLSFGLKRRNVAPQEIAARVRKASSILGLDELLQRKPFALSGGQRQRVALGRAIVREPKVFLFDEPLSNLDAALRVNTRNELVRLHQRLKSTMIYVTHDQVEAMTMGQRICVMNKGRVAQIGRPMDVYRAPADAFVARFLGNPPMNIVKAKVVDGDGERKAHVGTSGIALARWSGVVLGTSDDLLIGVRPEELSLSTGNKNNIGQATWHGSVAGVEPLGAETLVIVDLENKAGQITARLHRDTLVQVDQSITLQCSLDAIYLFDATTEKAIVANGA